MNSVQLLGMVAGAAVGLGLWLLVNGLRRQDVRPRPPSKQPIDIRRLAVATAALAGTAVLTRWPVAALAASLLAWWWPRVADLSAGQRQLIGRLEALATWTESLRDAVAGAIGLEQAIPATAAGCPTAIRPQVQRLAGQLQARAPMERALRALAVELADPSADLVVAALLLSAQLRGPGLRDTLTSLAASARAELQLRQKVEAGRATIRRGAAIIGGVTVLFAVALMLLNRTYLHPYDALAGQLVLALVLTVFGTGFARLGRLSRRPASGRIFQTERGAR